MDKHERLRQPAIRRVFMITRRDTARLLFATAAFAALPTGLSAATKEEWGDALSDALKAATVPRSGTRLSLWAFGFDKRGKTAGMSAVVAMDWPPGYRRRKFEVSETGEQEAFKGLVRQIVEEFRSANPDGVRDVAFR